MNGIRKTIFIILHCFPCLNNNKFGIRFFVLRSQRNKYILFYCLWTFSGDNNCTSNFLYAIFSVEHDSLIQHGNYYYYAITLISETNLIFFCNSHRVLMYNYVLVHIDLTIHIEYFSVFSTKQLTSVHRLKICSLILN